MSNATKTLEETSLTLYNVRFSLEFHATASIIDIVGIKCVNFYIGLYITQTCFEFMFLWKTCFNCYSLTSDVYMEVEYTWKTSQYFVTTLLGFIRFRTQDIPSIFNIFVRFFLQCILTFVRFSHHSFYIFTPFRCFLFEYMWISMVSSMQHTFVMDAFFPRAGAVNACFKKSICSLMECSDNIKSICVGLV